MKKWMYKNILQTSTLQFDGHIRDYFIENSKRTVAFYILPRSGSLKNFIEVYENGRLIKKIVVFSPKNILLAYISYYLQYLFILFRIFPPREKIYFINHQPIFFFLNSIIRIFKNIEIVYWVADYWPMNTVSIKIFRFLIHFYHDRSENTLYMSDRINRKLNGRIMMKSNKKTVMLGIRPKKINTSEKITKDIILCFIGVIVESQGIELIFEIISKRSDIKLKLIGSGNKELVEKYQKIIEQYKISDRVYFPNKFFYGDKLYKEILDCHAGIALYKVNKNTAAYFADPAKIKQYTEFGLPIIMTSAAEVADYIEHFHAGIIVKRNVNSVDVAIEKLKKNYYYYLSGLRNFNNHFNYKKYYNKSFQFIEAD